MYNNFFGFREKPFKLVPNPDFLYLSRSHQIALAHLTYAVDQGDGFAVITGEVGTGKTTLCRIFLERLDADTESAYIFNPKLDSVQLLNTICNEFGIRTNHGTIKQLLDVINGYLILKSQSDQKVILLIDEAQNLSIENLEMVRMLSNLETTRSKLLQIILVGQPELADKLDSYELRQLSQRISLSAHLIPLNFQETTGYIQHRVNIAAQRQLALFSRGACHAIFQYSRGIPRLINIVCDRALLTAYSLESSKVTAAIARQAIAEIASRGRVLPRSPRRWTTWLAAAVGAVLVLSVLFANLQSTGSRSRPADDGGTADQAASYPILLPARSESAPVGSGQPVSIPDTPTARQPGEKSGAGRAAANSPEHIDAIIESLEQQSSRLEAVTLLLALWGQPAPHPAQLPAMVSDPEFFDIAAHQYGLRAYSVQWDWALIRQLDLPAIVAFRYPGRQQVAYMTLTRWEDGLMHLAGGPEGQSLKADLQGLTPYLQGAVYVFWKNITQFDGIVSQAAPERTIAMIKSLLRRVGYSQLGSDPVFDADTRRMVIDFQMRHNLVPDGLVGPVTKMLLIKETGAVDAPRLLVDAGTKGDV